MSSSHGAARAPEPPRAACAGEHQQQAGQHPASAPFSFFFLLPLSSLSLLTSSLFSLLQDRELPWMLHRAQVQQSNPGSRTLLNPVQIQAVPVGSVSPRHKSLESCRRTFFQREGAALERNNDRSPGCVDPQASRLPGHSARRVTALVHAWCASHLATARPLACTLRRGPSRSCSSASRPKETNACLLFVYASTSEDEAVSSLLPPRP